MKTVTSFTIAIVATFMSNGAMAQNSSTEFRLAADAKNIAGCTNADAGLSRVHTLTIKDGAAELKSAGGVNDKMKLVRPNVYSTDFSLGPVHLVIVADLAATPKALTVSDRNLGCKWNATAP